MNKGIRFILKFILSFSLLAYILSKVNLFESLKAFTNINISLLALAVTILTLNIILLSYRWKKILSKTGFNLPFLKLLKINYISIFLGQLLPMRIGSDIIKGYYLSRDIKSIFLLSFSIITDRFMGISAFIFLNILSIIFGYKLLPAWIITVVIAIDITLMFIILLIIKESFFKKVASFIKFSFLHKLKEKIIKEKESISRFKNDTNLQLKLFCISLLINLTLIILNYVYALAIGISLPFYYFIIFIPISITITILPITLNGLGLREYLIIVMFTTAGLTAEQALSLGLISRIVLILYSLIGGIFYMIEGKKGSKYQNEKTKY